MEVAVTLLLILGKPVVDDIATLQLAKNTGEHSHNFCDSDDEQEHPPHPPIFSPPFTSHACLR